jgi:hypothetical protein
MGRHYIFLNATNSCDIPATGWTFVAFDRKGCLDLA